ncbi:NACHT, LRR and PYD domains-containing protein 1b allele 3-like [Hyperolius riggenbachi]|uniref:NACHT, LRR and PYD domains-containing protein 1b allele 3-like n=1 Tax=Hyperolius riggenbachi TaxID=752182 RepID=UPI0035A36EF3
MASVKADLTGVESIPVKKEEETGVLIPSLQGKKYKLQLTPNGLDRCSDTGIAFQVKRSTTVEYEVEYGSQYMKLVEEKKCELVGPLFNLKFDDNSVLCVHLPHYVNIKGENNSKIECGYFKDGKVNTKTPFKIESSSIVLKNPTPCCVGALWGSSFWRKNPVPFSAKVLLYASVLMPHKQESKEYKVHLYLIPAEKPELKKLDTLKAQSGFKLIDKPSDISRDVYENTDYTVTVEDPKAIIFPSVLNFKPNRDISQSSFVEITVAGSAEKICLSLKDKRKQLWKGELTKGDLKDLIDEMTSPAEEFPPGQDCNHHTTTIAGQPLSKETQK